MEHRIEQETTKAEVGFTAPDARILAVDDNQSNLTIVKLFLKKNGIVPDLCKSGSQAIKLCKENKYDLILMDHMKSAELDMNIAFSGSTVTATTPENYASRYGTTASAWYGKDYTTRFIECGGCGRPDIILIHGGTNDWSHNVDPLAPGVAIRNDVANSYGGHAPSAEVMQSIFDKADAAKVCAIR